MELTIEITNECKNNCIHCSSNATSDARKIMHLPVDVAVKAVKEVRPGKVILSGGEPFLHPDLDSMIREIKPLCSTLAINTSAAFKFDNDHAPRSLHLVDEFYVSIFGYNNDEVTRNSTWEYSGKPLFFAMILNMYSENKACFNVVVLFKDQANDIASIAYHTMVPVHVMKLVRHGRATGLDTLSVKDQLAIATDIIDQLDPSRIDARIPPFLIDDGHDPLSFSIIKDEVKRRLEKIHPRCKISHSLKDGKCRAPEKRTLLVDGRLIGCVAGKGIDERAGIIKVCERDSD